jgi:hypothetical protein
MKARNLVDSIRLSTTKPLLANKTTSNKSITSPPLLPPSQENTMKARKLVDSIKHEHGYCLEREGMPLRPYATFTVLPYAVICQGLCYALVLCYALALCYCLESEGMPHRAAATFTVLPHAVLCSGSCYALLLFYALSRARLLSRATPCYWDFHGTPYKV